MEVDFIAIEEVVWYMGRLVRIRRIFGISRHVDSTEGDLTSMGVLEVAIFDGEP